MVNITCAKCRVVRYIDDERYFKFIDKVDGITRAKNSCPVCGCRDYEVVV